jgi:two-component system chemotaxis response regulator CheB
VYGKQVLGVILSGMLKDGAHGALAVKAHGGAVIAQDKESAEFFGMPGAAIEAGAVDFVLPLGEIAPTILRLSTGEPNDDD